MGWYFVSQFGCIVFAGLTCHSTSVFMFELTYSNRTLNANVECKSNAEPE